MENNTQEKKSPGPSAFFLLAIILLVITALTYIVPAGQYETEEKNGRTVPIGGTYKSIESTPQGLWELLKSPIDGFGDALPICLYVLVIGGFLEMVKSTGAIDNGIKALIKSLKGREILFIPILSYIAGVGGSTFGMEEETVAFMGLITIFFVSAGYDSAVAMMCLLPGAVTGIAGALINPFSVGMSANFLGVNMFAGAPTRAIIYILFEGILSFFTIRYALMVKNDPTKSIVYDELQALKKEYAGKGDNMDSEFTGKQKLILTIFAGSYIFMAFSIIPWGTYGIHIFEQLNEAILKTVFIGHPLALGEWYFTETPVIFLTASVLIGIIAGYKEGKIVDIFLQGAKDLLPVVLIIAVSRGISIIMKNGHIDATVLNFGETYLKDVNNVLFIVGTFLFYLPLNLLITSTSALSTLTMPILGPLAHFKGVPEGSLITAFSCSIGIVNILSPASGTLMADLSITRVPYQKWIKLIFPYVATAFVLDIILLAVSVTFGI